MLVSVLLIVLTLLYGGLLYYFKTGWEAIPEEPNPTLLQGDWPTVAIIIPARNEEKNIGNLLKALSNQSYPLHKMEVLVIDDHSTDGTASIVSQFPFAKSILQEEEGIISYKKKALEKGIANTSINALISSVTIIFPCRIIHVIVTILPIQSNSSTAI